MSSAVPASCTAFKGSHRIASGPLAEVARMARLALDSEDSGPVLVFNDLTGAVLDIDYRGSAEDVVRRLAADQEEESPAPPQAAPGRRAPGRPRLGVVGREVTLLPRHWEWLNVQPGGASVALRKLVEQARRADDVRGTTRRSQEAAYRFMSAMAGNERGYEEAARALFAGDGARFAEHTESWPIDVRDYARTLARLDS